MFASYKGKCTLDIYVRFLLAQPMRAECTRLANLVPNMAHDAVNRFLLKSQFEPQDLFNLARKHLDLCGGTLSVDDTTLDKPYSKLEKCPLLGRFYSSKHKTVVKGLSLIPLIYTDPKGVMLPVHYAIAKTQEDVNRNQLFRKMFKEVISWGLKPEIVTFDNAYASWDNFRLLDRHHTNCLFSLGLDQQLYLRGQRVHINDLSFKNKQGKVLDCILVGTIKVFQQRKDQFQPRYYAFYSSDATRVQRYTRQHFRHLRAHHWGIERFHRCIKQNCCIEKFSVRKPQAILSHIFCSLLAFCHLEQAVIQKVQKSWYRLKTSILSHSLSQFIQSKNFPSPNWPSFYTTHSLISPIRKLMFDSS